MTDPRVARILDKLAAARTRQIVTFGSSTHRWRLDTPLTEDQVLELEVDLGVELPAEYRAFLISVGASGAGPYYGLLPPARWNNLLLGDVAMPDWASRPCVWWPEMIASADWHDIGAPLDEPFQGAIAIADQGCANYAALVVTGPARGKVVHVSLEQYVPYFPENDDFLSWYERWLDELLAGCTHFWFGVGMPGDEGALAAAAVAGSRRADALAAMFRLPGLSDDTARIVVRALDDGDPAVRANAFGVATRFGLDAAIEPRLHAALADPAVSVRTAALRAAVERGPPWHDAARALAADPDGELAALAIRLLDQKAALTAADLVKALAREGPVRMAAISAGHKVTSPALIEALLPLAAAAPDHRHPAAVIALTAQARLDALTAAQRAAFGDVLLERIARADVTGGRSAEINALGALVPELPGALDLLVELTCHADGYIRWDAVSTLGNVGGRTELPALRALFGDETMPRRRTAGGGSRPAPWSVGENARRAVAKIEAR